MYYTEKDSLFGIPSLALWPTGLDKSRMSRHLPRLVFLRDDPEATDMKVWSGGYGEGACDMAFLKFRARGVSFF